MVIEATVNVGNLIPLGLATVGFIVWLSRLGSAQRSTEEKVGELRSDRDKHEHRLRGVEQGNIAIGAKLDALFQMVADIREAVRSRLP